MIELLQDLISRFIAFAQSIFQAIFGGIDFTVLWSWLPSDIQAAANYLILVLFVLVIIDVIRRFLPF